MRPQWTPRAEPLRPGALVADKPVIAALHTRLGEAPDEVLGQLRGVTTDDAWILIGPEDALPWVDGVTYLARDPDAPSLWVPTYLALSPAAVLVERAIRARFREPPFALYGEPLCVVSLIGARPLDRARLAASAAEHAR